MAVNVLIQLLITISLVIYIFLNLINAREMEHIKIRKTCLEMFCVVHSAFSSAGSDMLCYFITSEISILFCIYEVQENS